MFRWRRPGVWIGLLVGLNGPVAAQADRAPRAELLENHPNPFFPSTTIPFEIHPEVCARGHQPAVTIRIYNVLVQVVAIPVLQDSVASRLDNVKLRCGSHQAVWDGKFLDGQRDAPDGVYYYQLLVDGERISTRKMIVRRERP